MSLTPAIVEIEKQIFELKKKRTELRKENPPEQVDDFVFEGWNGPVRLSQFFGDKSELIVVHNMGKHCNYCTLWADGFVSSQPHITTRAAFVVVNGDPVEIQKKVASDRGWTFTMARDAEKRFTQEMGFLEKDGSYGPGCSVFRKEADGSIVRVNATFFGPGDDFSPIWQFWDLLDGGEKAWHPKPVVIDGVSEKPMEEVTAEADCCEGGSN